jgi:MoxR-like ATPase
MSRKQNILKQLQKRSGGSQILRKADKLYASLNSQIPHGEKQVLYNNAIKLSQLENMGVHWNSFEKSTRELAEMNPAKYTQEVQLFEKILDNDLITLRVSEIKDAQVQTVYDLQVSGHHNFFGNHICMHNCMIDELDKMSTEDRSAFHEALEQQQVTISKANIQATLRCETVVLAAANPKFGRFDPYELLAKQIELPSTLINRFDLIFPVRDLPSVDKDGKMADFILRLHQTGDVEEVPIDTKILTKYISYARSSVFPHLTDGALKEIRKFYVEMRNSGTGEEGISAIPISARQLEALVRLTEASARTRLAKEATRDDARRAIDLVMYCLQQLGVDPDTGKMDIDRLTTGVTASTRNHVHMIKQIIRELAELTGESLVAEEEILAKAEEKNIDEVKAEEILERLNRMGDIFRPKPGYYSMMK